MTYGAAVWTPQFLEGLDEAHTRSPLGQLAVLYRQGLRVLLALSVDIRMELVYILTLRWPLAVALAKATWRYYRRVRDMATSEDPSPLGMAARWAQAQDVGGYVLQRGLEWMGQYGSIQEIYQQARAQQRAAIRESARLAHPALQQIWEDILDISTIVQRQRAHIPVGIPLDQSTEYFRTQLSQASWTYDQESDTLYLLGRPSWLLHSSRGLGRVVELFYQQTGWVESEGVLERGEGEQGRFTFFIASRPTQGHAHIAMQQLIQATSLAVGLWVDSWTVCDMIESY